MTDRRPVASLVYQTQPDYKTEQRSKNEQHKAQEVWLESWPVTAEMVYHFILFLTRYS